MTDIHSDNVLINDSADEVQLVVQGSASQSEALQQWKNDSGEILSQVDAEGQLQVGDVDGTIDALLESHNLEDSSKPARGFHTKGILNGTLNSLVSWAVSELGLKGTGGLSALHRALRVQATNENTGAMDSGADVRAGDFEAINIGGNGSSNNLEMSAVVAKVNNQSGATLDKAYGLKVEIDDDGSSNDVYAIYTDNGKVRLGDVLELADDSVHAPLSIIPRTTAPTSPQENDIYLHQVSVGNYVWKRYTGSAWEDVGVVSDHTHDLATDVTGTLAIANGGTGATTANNARLNLEAQEELSGANLSSVTVSADDKVLIQDTSDSDNLKTATVQSIADIAGGAKDNGSFIPDDIYSSSTTTWVDIDGTDFSFDLTITGTSILTGFSGYCEQAGSSSKTFFTIAVDGVVEQDGQGLAMLKDGGFVAFTHLITGLTPGPYTISIQWKRSNTNTTTLYADSTDANRGAHRPFWAQEV